MFISDITYKTNSVTVICDGSVYELDPDAVYRSHLKKGADITESSFRQLLALSDSNLCLKYLFSQISNYAKTEKGYREKLKQKGFYAESIDLAIDKAKEKGYINDIAFAEKYYEKNKKQKGVYRIIEELKQKGVPSDALRFLREIETDKDIIIAIAKKEMRNRQKTDAERVKLMRKLSSKGFSYNEIINAINVVFSSDEE